MKSFVIKGKVWVYPGLAGWHFIYLNKTLSNKIQKIAVGHRYGSGFIKIRAKIGKTTWDTALFPHKKEGVYLISIKASVRKKEEIIDGDTVTIKCTLLKV